MPGSDIYGNVFNIQRFSLDDGDGIRTCVFLKGCPLDCKWCHNEESKSFKTEIAYYPENCILCRTCKTACKFGLHDFPGNIHVYNRSKCTACGKCAKFCPTNTLVSVGKRMSVNEVMETVAKDTLFYGNNGGLTLTGGEPMAQFEFSSELAKQAKLRNISVVIETSGYASSEKFEFIAKYCDCFYYDCKSDSKLHEQFTGKSDELIVKNLDLLARLKAPVVLRCPIVPGVNLTNEYIDKIIFLGKSHSNIIGISLLPYHKNGIGKAKAIGKNAQQAYKEPDAAFMEQLRQKIESAANVKVR